MYLTNAFKHTKKILVHKANVARYCFMCGLYFQGITHDLSKFSPTEFFESIKYYAGTESPITVCKRTNGVSLAWLHHRGRNKHHWEYWVDDFQDGMKPKKMPFKYVLEMICDFLGAGKAYAGKKFTIEMEYAWWLSKRDIVVMNEATKMLVNVIFDKMNRRGIKNVLTDKALMKRLEQNYNRKEYGNG